MYIKSAIVALVSQFTANIPLGLMMCKYRMILRSGDLRECIVVNVHYGKRPHYKCERDMH